MEVQVGSYYHDPSLGSQREIHVTISEEDVRKYIPAWADEWDDWSYDVKMRHMYGLADITMLRYAESRHLRPRDTVESDIRTIIAKDFQ